MCMEMEYMCQHGVNLLSDYGRMMNEAIQYKHLTHKQCRVLKVYGE